MLDKRECRKYADPGLTNPQGHGLLHVPQVDYIIRTAVRIISHRRTLALYVYNRKQAADGIFTPAWTMFQAGDDYITLARREDGSTYWRTAAFERLGDDYYFTCKCAFYSAQDEHRVCDFFRDHDHSGITALLRAQQAIIDKRCRERKRGREMRTIARMRPLHALPRGLEGWVRREVMPAYFRCEHTSVRRPVAGICTSCGKEVTLPNAAHNSKITCPHCKRELTVKSIGKVGRTYDRDTVQAVEKISDDEIVARIVKVYYDYDRDRLMPTERTYENARIFIRRGPDGKVKTEPYYYSYSKGTLTHWMPGDRPIFYPYSDNFEAGTCGHVYCRGLPKALAGTPWEYCPVAAFYDHFHEPMQMWPFLAAHLEHPRFEHLVKMGFYKLVCELVYHAREHYPAPELDETQNRTHRLLGVGPEDVEFLQDRGTGMRELLLIQAYYRGGVKDRQKLLTWQMERKIDKDLSPALAHTTPHKLMRYTDGQHALLQGREGQYGGLRYESAEAVILEYLDYLGMCQGQHYDLKNSFVLFPKDLQKSHDRVAARIKIKADMKMREEFQRAYKRVKGQLDFERDGMKIVYPASLDDIVAEGQTLHHCVGGYVSKVAAHKTMILFLRRCEEAEKPFYTVEVLHGKVEQVRGIGNCEAAPEVEAFMSKWERQVL